MSEKSKFTTSINQLMQLFPNEDKAIEYFEKLRWNGIITCVYCESKRTSPQKRKPFHQCKDCRKVFTVRTKSVFARSHVPLQKWLFTMYFLQTSRKGISSVQLSKEIGVTQTTAWFLLRKLRESSNTLGFKLEGIV